MEGMMMEYAIEVIQKKAMKAEEQRCLRRRQVWGRIGLSLVLALLVGMNIRGILAMRVFADGPIISISEMYGKTDKEPEYIQDSEFSELSAYTPRPYYTSIRVEQGDSLWSIASQYAAKSPMDVQGYVEELKRINRLSTDTIHAGHYLMVVYYK